MNTIYMKLRNDRIYEITEKIDAFYIFLFVFTVFINFVFIHTHLFFLTNLDVIIKNYSFAYNLFFMFDITDILFILFFLIFRKKIYSIFYRFYGIKKIPNNIKKKLIDMNIDLNSINIK